MKPQYAAEIIKACVVLHNLLIRELLPTEEELQPYMGDEVVLNGFGLEDEQTSDEDEEIDVPMENNHARDRRRAQIVATFVHN